MARGKLYYNKLLVYTISIIDPKYLPTLLEKADINYRHPKTGMTALHILARDGYLMDNYKKVTLAKEIVANIGKNGKERFLSQASDFYTLASENDPKIFAEKIAILVERSIAENIKDRDMTDSDAIAKAKIKALNATLNALDNNNFTPMDYAAGHTSSDILKRFIMGSQKCSEEIAEEQAKTLHLALDKKELFIKDNQIPEIISEAYRALYDFYDECNPSGAYKKGDSSLSTSDLSEHSELEQSLSASSEVARILFALPQKLKHPMPEKLSHTEIQHMLKDLNPDPESSADITGGSLEFSDIARSESESTPLNTSDLVAQLSDAQTPSKTPSPAGTDEVTPVIFSASTQSESDELRKTTIWTKDGIKKPGSFVERISPTRSTSRSTSDRKLSAPVPIHPTPKNPGNDRSASSAPERTPSFGKQEASLKSSTDDLLRMATDPERRMADMPGYDEKCLLDSDFSETSGGKTRSHSTSFSDTTVDLDASSELEQQPKFTKNLSYGNLINSLRRLEDAAKNPDPFTTSTRLCQSK